MSLSSLMSFSTNASFRFSFAMASRFIIVAWASAAPLSLTPARRAARRFSDDLVE